MAKRRTEGTPPRGAPRPMQSPPDQQAVDSAQVLSPRDGSNVGLPQTPARGAAPRHSQEATQPARSTPSRKQRETPPRLSHMQTQPMEWAPEVTQPNTDNLPQVMVTESRAQYQQTGECHVAHIIDAAQLTHPISSAEDADMQLNPATPRPDTHDIATPRRSIGGRCRRWAVSTAVGKS